MRRPAAICGLVLCAFAAATAHASAAPAPADLDRSFGMRGIAPGGSFNSAAPARLAVGPGNGIFVLYRNFPPLCAELFCESELSVARFERGGRRDVAFGFGGSGFRPTQHRFQSGDLAVGPDGKPVIATLDFRRPSQHIVVARLGADGRLDTSFGGGGVAEVPTDRGGAGWPAVAVQGDGRVLVAVAAPSAGGLLLARFLPSGILDPSFGDGGLAVASFGSLSQPAGLILGADGSILVGLSQCCDPIFNKSLSLVFARFLADGRLDPSFGGGAGWVAVSRPLPSRLTAIAPAPRGGAYALLEAERRHVERRTLALELRADGRLARRFGRRGVVGFGRAGRAPQVTAIAADARGRLIAAAGSRRGILTRRLLANGRRDRTFADGGYTRTAVGAGGASVAGARLQASGHVVLLAETGAGEARQFVLARLRAGNGRAHRRDRARR